MLRCHPPLLISSAVFSSSNTLLQHHRRPAYYSSGFQKHKRDGAAQQHPHSNDDGGAYEDEQYHNDSSMMNSSTSSMNQHHHSAADDHQLPPPTYLSSQSFQNPNYPPQQQYDVDNGGGAGDFTSNQGFAAAHGLDEQQQRELQALQRAQEQNERSGTKISRERAQEQNLSDQFSSLYGGWHKGEDKRFDLYVDEKRRQSQFEEFDQRVQRAYTRAVRQHRAEVWNGYKRQLKRTGDKLTPKVLQAVNNSIGEREEWLRDVFTQLDTDYRSSDPERQNRATVDLRAALDGRAGELLQNHYDRKIERRHAGPKQQKLMDQQSEDDVDGPNISDDEVNRYLGLKPNIAAIENAVIERYGRAGREHWDMLQYEKDAEYQKKLDDAAAIYNELIEQQQAYDESKSNESVKEYVRRVSRAMVRFRTAMEVEATREELIDAHEKMKQERKEDAEKRRLERMKIAAEMKASGVPTEDVRKTLKQQSLDYLNDKLSQRVVAEKEEDRARKRVFLQMIDQLEFETETQEGQEHMMKQSSSSSSSIDALRERANQFSSPQIKEIFDETSELATNMKQKTEFKDIEDDKLTRKALWEVLSRDRWEDPFFIVHNARYQAEKNYDQIYALTQPTKLRLGRKSNRGTSANLGAGEERHILQDPWVETHTHIWGVKMEDMHNLDPDTSKEYFADHLGWHIRDPKTRDMDFRYEKRLGRGLRWTGPTFYKRGIDARNRNNLENRPVVEDPTTPLQRH